MNNFQLYRTNVLLGGQMKWDIIIDNDENTLHVSNFNLTPISKNISYVQESNEFKLKNTHSDNVKAFFNKLQGDFYNEALDSNFDHNWPIISNDPLSTKIYFDTYDMGCRRTEFYNLYKKQFEFFCPLWLEQLNGSLSFKFVIKSASSNEVIASKMLYFKNNAFQYHNRFVKYFNDHIARCEIDDGNDNILNIDFDKNTAIIHGLDVKTGIIETKDISNIINQFTSRERPLMETDNIIISSFADNNMICNNLYNFNFCFNLTDIVTSTIANMLYGKNITVSVYAMDNDGVFATKDFYTEYEYMNKELYYDDGSISDRSLYKDLNVLDYLNDHSYLEFKNKNKFCQKICHWSLCENNDYIFNLYNGFSGYCIQNGNIIENSYQYGKSPNTYSTKHSFSLNNSGWLNTVEMFKWNDMEEMLLDLDHIYEIGNNISKNNYINNIKYNIASIKYNDKPLKDSDFFLLNIHTDNNTLMSLIVSDTFDKYIISSDTSDFITCLVKLKNAIVLISDNYDGLTFKNIYNMLVRMNIRHSASDDYLKLLFDFMSSQCDPKIIHITSSLSWDYVKGPSHEVQEIEYFKNNYEYTYVMRYDGRIKPTFIDGTTLCNSLYYKDTLKDNAIQHSKYYKYSNSGFEPIYPSLNYDSINKADKFDYDMIPYVRISSSDDKIKLVRGPEYSWFNTGSIMHISPELNFKYVNKPNSDTGEYDSLNSIVYYLLKSYYNIDDDATIRYIMDIYEIKNTWEYLSNDNIADYMYDIQLIMK